MSEVSQIYIKGIKREIVLNTGTLAAWGIIREMSAEEINSFDWTKITTEQLKDLLYVGLNQAESGINYSDKDVCEIISNCTKAEIGQLMIDMGMIFSKSIIMNN